MKIVCVSKRGGGSHQEGTFYDPMVGVFFLS